MDYKRSLSEKTRFLATHIPNMTFMNIIHDFYELTFKEIYWILIVVNKFPVPFRLKQIENYD